MPVMTAGDIGAKELIEQEIIRLKWKLKKKQSSRTSKKLSAS